MLHTIFSLQKSFSSVYRWLWQEYKRREDFSMQKRLTSQGQSLICVLTVFLPFKLLDFDIAYLPLVGFNLFLIVLCLTG